jgi:hypothetical protein
MSSAYLFYGYDLGGGDLPWEIAQADGQHRAPRRPCCGNLFADKANRSLLASLRDPDAETAHHDEVARLAGEHVGAAVIPTPTSGGRGTPWPRTARSASISRPSKWTSPT